jgi:hypothetical protein
LITRRYRSFRSRSRSGHRRAAPWAQVRRDDRHAVEHHARGAVAGGQERRDDLETLQRAGLALALAGGDDLAQRLRLGLQVERLEPLLDGGAPIEPSKYLPKRYVISR